MEKHGKREQFYTAIAEIQSLRNSLMLARAIFATSISDVTGPIKAHEVRRVEQAVSERAQNVVNRWLGPTEREIPALLFTEYAIPPLFFFSLFVSDCCAHCQTYLLIIFFFF